MEGTGHPGKDEAMTRLGPGFAEVRFAGGDVKPSDTCYDAEVVELVLRGECFARSLG